MTLAKPPAFPGPQLAQRRERWTLPAQDVGGEERALPLLMPCSAAGWLAVAWLPPRGLPPRPGPQPQARGAGWPWAGHPGLCGAQPPGGVRLHIPVGQRCCHPTRVHSCPPACLPLPLCPHFAFPEGMGGGWTGDTGVQSHRSRGGGQRAAEKQMRSTIAGPQGDAQEREKRGRERPREPAATAPRRVGRGHRVLQRDSEQERHTVTLRLPGPRLSFCPTPDPPLASELRALEVQGGRGRP